MDIVTTPQELLNRASVGAWDKVCEHLGLNPWCVNEGQMDGGEEIRIPEELAREIGLIPGGES